MIQNKLSILFIFLLIIITAPAKAQVYTEMGWPDDFHKIIEETQRATWAISSVYTRVADPSNSSRTKSILQKETYNGVTTDYSREYFYSSNNNFPDSIVFKLVSSGEPLSYEKFTYNAQNKITGVKWYSYQNNAWKYIMLDTYVYDANNNAVSGERFGISNTGNQNKLLEYDFTYNSNNQLITFTENKKWDVNGDYEPYMKHIFTYNANSKLQKIEISEFDGSEWYNFIRFNFDFSTSIKTAESKPNIQVFPNPCKNVVKIASLGNTQVELFNISGQKMQITNYNRVGNYTELDLTGIPNGSYILHCTDGIHLYNQVLIKN